MPKKYNKKTKEEISDLDKLDKSNSEENSRNTESMIINPFEVKQEAMSMVKEFKSFVLRGNVIELIVGLTVGVSFTKFINSVVSNILMPFVGMILNDSAFDQLYFNLGKGDYNSLAEAEEAGAPVVKYGQALADLLDLLILALVIYLMLKFVFKYRFEKKATK